MRMLVDNNGAGSASANDFEADGDSGISDHGADERGREIFYRIADLMEKYRTPYTPDLFEIWYAYVIGYPKETARSVHETITRTGTLPDYDIKQIADELRKGKPGDMSLQEIVGCHLEHVIASLDNDVDAQMRANGSHYGVLQSVSQLLRSRSNPSDLGAMVTVLVKQIDIMRDETKSLTAKLSESRRQVRKLRNSLAKSRISELRDPLTGLANRRHFNTVLARELAKSLEKGGGLCLVMADLDNFKDLNDKFGHLVGDQVLKLFAEMLTRSFKGRDLPARFGGEEFSIILTDIDITTAARLVDALRAELEDTSLQVVTGKIPIGAVTASFGIAEIRSGDTPHQLINRADKRLYRAKEGGRNRVVATD